MIRILSFMIASIIVLAMTGQSMAQSRETRPLPKQVYNESRTYARAKIEKIEKNRNSSYGHSIIETKIHIRLLDGPEKGKRRTALYRGEDDLPKDISYREGDTVFVGISDDTGRDALEHISLYDVDNTPGILVFLVLLGVIIILVGRLKGLLAILSLCGTIILIFFVMIPLTLKGYSPVPVTLGIALVAIVVTIPVVMGRQRKTLAAVLGASAGIILSTLLSLVAGWLMHLSGIVTNEMLTIFYASSVQIDLRGLAHAGIIIAALGAIMDVCMSIASATEEIYRVNPGIAPSAAFRSVFNVSSDILGATVNTLLFAYVGSALSLILSIALRYESGMSVWMVVNYNPVLSELIKSIIGCMGMFLSLPITAFICIGLHQKKENA